METKSENSMAIIYIGADISKSKIDFYGDFEGKRHHEIIENETVKLSAYVSGLVVRLSGHQVQIIMEATGTYGDRLMQCLYERGIAFSVISPSNSRAFMKSENLTTINDKQAARTLSLFGQQKKPEPYRMPCEVEVQLKQIITAIDTLKEDFQLH